jgi:hypothetical protein
MLKPPAASWSACSATTELTGEAMAESPLAADSACATCRHAATVLAAGGCDPHDVCVTAVSGRRIDRFLRTHPEFAGDYLADGFWERRAIAARYAVFEAILPLAKDTDEVVRRVVASRLPPAMAASMMRDPDREVRITVAHRVEHGDLLKMAGDPDYMVRVVVARRLSHGKLPRLATDPEREVRKTVAARLPAFALSRLLADPEPEVRRIVAARALPHDALLLLEDEDWLVRLAAVQRAPLETIRCRLADPEAEVRRAVWERLAAGEGNKESNTENVDEPMG